MFCAFKTILFGNLVIFELCERPTYNKNDCSHTLCQRMYWTVSRETIGRQGNFFRNLRPWLVFAFNRFDHTPHSKNTDRQYEGWAAFTLSNQFLRSRVGLRPSIDALNRNFIQCLMANHHHFYNFYDCEWIISIRSVLAPYYMRKIVHSGTSTNFDDIHRSSSH